MEDVFAPYPPRDGEGTGESQQPAQQPQEPQEQPQQPPPEEPGTAAPPAAGAEHGKHVPVDVLEAVRGERNDWKGKATEAQTEARMLREQLQRFQQQQRQPGQPGGEQPPPEDPVQRQVLRMENVVLNTSERAARRDHGSETVDKAWARVQDEFKQNPALYHQIVNAPDPWDQVVQQGKRLLAMDEIGSDPVAFRKKLEEEIRASLTAAAGAAPQSTTSPAPRLPESLAGARSAGARGTVYTGPVPFENFFDR